MIYVAMRGVQFADAIGLLTAGAEVLQMSARDTRFMWKEFEEGLHMQQLLVN